MSLMIALIDHPDASTWKYCYQCGSELVHKKDSSPYAYDVVTGTPTYEYTVRCIKYTASDHNHTRYHYTRKEDAEF